MLSTFIKLPSVFKSFVYVLSIFEWPLKTGFTVALFTFQFEVEAEEFFSELKIDESELDKIMIAGKS